MSLVSPKSVVSAVLALLLFESAVCVNRLSRCLEPVVLRVVHTVVCACPTDDTHLIQLFQAIHIVSSVRASYGQTVQVRKGKKKKQKGQEITKKVNSLPTCCLLDCLSFRSRGIQRIKKKKEKITLVICHTCRFIFFG